MSEHSDAVKANPCNTVRVCGERGLCTWCPACKDYAPFELRGRRAHCRECSTQLPRLPSYRKVTSE